MARKFIERENPTTLNFFDGSGEGLKAAIDTRIAEIEDILDDPIYKKELMAAGVPGANTEEAFDAIFTDELHQLADQGDWFDNTTVTAVEAFDAVDYRWMSPSDMYLDPGTIESFCGEEVGSEAIQAIDGINGTNWQHDVDEVHELVIDLGYIKRIDGIRISLSAVPAGPLQLSTVQVYVAGIVAKLDDAESHVGVDLEFTDGNDNDRDLTIRNGRYVKLEIGSTGHASNHITIREIQFRFKPRTAEL